MASVLRSISTKFLTRCMSKKVPYTRHFTALESQGMIESSWGVSENNRRARFYQLSPRGQKQVAVQVSNWRRMVEAVNRVIDPVVS